MARLPHLILNSRTLVYERYRRLCPPLESPPAPVGQRDPRLAAGRIVWPRSYIEPEAGKWVGGLATEFAKAVPFATEDLPQSSSAVQFLFRSGHRDYPVVIDFGDYPDEIQGSALDGCVAYFKMQFRRGGYGDPRVLPGGYVPASDRIYHYLRPLRRARDRRPERFDVYGRFGVRFAGPTRTRVVAALTGQRRFGYEGGLKLVRYSRFLQEVARAKICIDLPGNGDFCYRLVDYFAVGSCVLAARHGTTFPAPLVDREHLAYFADDGSDLLDLCDYYLSRPDERRRLVENSRRYFDAHLHRAALARYYLREIASRLGE